MAKINRYTQLSGPKFDPLSFEQLSLVPMQLRQQQDELERQASELGVFDDINRLSVDDPLVKQTISDYEQKISDYSDRLQNEGFSNLNKQELRNLARTRRDLLSPTGTLGKATNAYNAYKANEKQLADMYKKGDISADEYQLGLQKSLNAYNQAKGVEGDATYNPFNAYKRQDIVEKARDIAKDIQANPRKLETLGFTSRTLPNGLTRYYETETGREYTPEGAIQAGVQTLLKMDQDVVNDLTQRQQLGLIQDPDAYLKGLGQTYEDLYSKDNISRNRSGYFDPLQLHSAKKKLDESQEEGVPYVYDPVDSKTISDKSFLSKLNQIESKELIDINPVRTATQQIGAGTGLGTPNIIQPNLQEATVENNLTPEEKIRYDAIKNKLFPGDLINTIPEEQQIAEISKYLNTYKDIQYSNPIVKPFSSSGPISSSLLLNTKDMNKTNRELTNEVKSRRTKLWDKKGNPVKLEDLPDGFKVEYIGYVSPSNVLPTFKNADNGQSVVPHVIQIQDPDDPNKVQEVYASRSDYERNKPEFEAYKIIKQTTNDGIFTPGLPNTYNLNSQDKLYKKGINSYDVGYDPLSKTYNIKVKLRDGREYNESQMPPDKYESFWYNIIKE